MTDPAADLAAFMGDQLAAKGNKTMVMRDPTYRQPGGDQVDGVDHSLEVDTSSPERAVKTAIDKYGLPKDDAELLAGLPADRVEEMASRLAVCSI